MTPTELTPIETQETSVESKKSVYDLIIGKFKDSIEDDALFQGITDDLIKAVQDKKLSKKQIEEVLQRKYENQTTEN